MITIQKRNTRPLHRKVAIWQRAACGLFALAVAGNCVLYGIAAHQEERAIQAEAAAERWRERYSAAVQIEQEAVQAYGQLLVQTKEEEAARAAQMAFEGYRYIGECTLTAYCCESKDNPHICGTGTGLTASGLPVEPGMVAVDPDVIPLGSTVVIGGVEYLAADTGVKGLHVDMALPTHAEAEAFGVQTAEVWVVPPGEEGEAR